MDEQGADDRKNGGRSVPLFDPVAGMRAMAEIQADGLRAASDLLDRMLAGDNDDPAARPPSPERDYRALVDAWSELLQRLAAGMARPDESGPVTVPVDSSSVGPPVRLTLERPEQDATAVAEIWVHNGTSIGVGPLALCCGALTAPSGEVLDVNVEFDPSEVPLLPPRSSRGVAVSVAPRSRPSPGTYRGTIQADGAPALWLPVEVAVQAC